MLGGLGLWTHKKPISPNQAAQPAHPPILTQLKGTAAALTANQDSHREIIPSDNLPTE